MRSLSKGFKHVSNKCSAWLDEIWAYRAGNDASNGPGPCCLWRGGGDTAPAGTDCPGHPVRYDRRDANGCANGYCYPGSGDGATQVLTATPTQKPTAMPTQRPRRCLRRFRWPQGLSR
ncbi:MAG: hypothetical protein HC884_07900 [Chloroflexaceae bacterium]|nr:hypothetical protein [Chloroflexaceae bacterium]